MDNKRPLSGWVLNSFFTFIKGRNKMNQKFWGVVLTLALVFGLAAAGHAAITADLAQSLVTAETPVMSGSADIAAVGINLAGNAGETLTQVVVTITGFDTFVAANLAAADAVALYKDGDGLLNNVDGAYDAGIDVLVGGAVGAGALAGAGAGLWTATIIVAGGDALPADDAAVADVDDNAGFDYFIVIKTAAGTEDDAFTVGISTGDITLSAGASSASATSAKMVFDSTLPTITSIDLLDNNANGKVDRLKVVFSEDVKADDLTAGVTINNDDPAAMGIASATESPAGTVTYLLDESDPLNELNSAGDAGDFVYAAAAGNITDVAGNALAAVAAGDIVEVDAMSAVIDFHQGVEIYDNDPTGDHVAGRIDQIILHFSEDLDETVASFAGLSVAGYTVSAMAYDGVEDGLEDVTLDIEEVDEGYDTGAQPEVTYGQAAGALKDLSGRKIASIFTNTAEEVDKAEPILISAYTRDKDADGKIDAYELTFSEHVVPTGDAALTAGFAGAGGLEAGFSFAAEGHTSEGTLVTLILNETVINTGHIPVLHSTPGGDLNDGATDAAGALDANLYAGDPTNDGKTKDGVSPIVKTIRTDDSDSDGKIDRVYVEFSESMKAGIDFKTGVTIQGYALEDPTHAFGSEVVAYVLKEGDAYDTNAIPLFSYTGAGNIVDAHDWPQAAIAATAAEDNAAPDVISAVTGDADKDGKIDQYVLTLSESIAALDAEADYDDNFAVAGHAITAPGADDVVKTAANALTFVINELGAEDTDAKPEVTYAQAGVNDIVDLNGIPLADADAAAWTETDGAKPVSIGDAETMDRDGDGYIDAFKISFSEPIAVNDSTATGLTVAVTENWDDEDANTVTIDSVATATIDAATQSAVFYGTSDEAGTWDTEAKPKLSYDAAAGTIGDTVAVDGPQNMMASVDIDTEDKAIPVLTRAIGQVQSKTLSVQFSEPVYNTAGGLGALEASDFAYDNVYNTGTNATAIVGIAEADGADEKVLLTANNNFLREDVEQDSLSVVSVGAVFDEDGNAAQVVYVTINDVVAPKVTAIITVDYDEDGLIDYLRVKFSEDIDDASLSGYVVADSMSADVSAAWDVAGFTGEQWNLYDYRGGANADDDDPVVNDLFDADVDGTDNLDVEEDIDIDGDGLDEVTVYTSLLEGGAVAFSDNRANDDILYLALDEASGAASAVTGAGNTDAAPAVAISDSVSDFKPNPLDVVNSVAVATDEVGPVIMLAKTIAVTKVEVTCSEDIADAELDVGDFTLRMPAEAGIAVQTIVRATEPSAGVVVLEVRPNAWWMPDMTGDVEFSGGGVIVGVLEDVLENINGHTANPGDTQVAVDDNVASTFSVAPPAAVAVGEAATVTVTALDSDGETDTNFAGEIALGVQSGGAAFPNGERYSLTAGVGSFSVIATSTDPLVIRASYDYGNEIVAAGLSAAITPTGLDAPDALAAADYPGDQGGVLLLTFDASSGQAAYYQIYREVIGAADTAGVADTSLVAWASVNAVPGLDPITVAVAAIDNAETRWAVQAVMGGEASGTVMPAAKRIGDQYLMALLDQQVVEIYGLGTFSQMDSQKDAKERIRLERLSPQLMALARGATIRAKMVGSTSSVITYSAEAARAVDNIAPAPVTGLDAVSSADNSSIVLSWVKSVDDMVVGAYTFGDLSIAIPGVEAYQILRKSGADDFAPIASVAAGATDFTDADVEIGVFYTYQVVAADLDNVSSDSPTIERSTGLVDVDGNVVVDFDGDATTGLGDFLEIVAVFGQSGAEIQRFDIDRDGSVGLGDFLAFVASFGRTAVSAKPIQMGLREDASLGLMLTSDAVRVGEPVSFDAVLTGADAISYGLTLRYDADTFEYVSDGSMAIDRNGTLTIAGTDPVRLVFLVREEFEGDASFEILDAMVLDREGLGLVRSESAVVSLTPTEFELSQNSPNPFNPETTIGYALPKSAHVRFEVLNVLGQVVRTLVDEQQRTGTYEVTWNGLGDSGQALASGIYFYRIGADNFQATKRMLLLK